MLLELFQKQNRTKKRSSLKLNMITEVKTSVEVLKDKTE